MSGAYNTSGAFTPRPVRQTNQVTTLEDWIAAKRRAANRAAAGEYLGTVVVLAVLVGLMWLGSWLTSLV